MYALFGVTLTPLPTRRLARRGMPNTDGAGCRVVAERMRTAIERIASAPRPLTASVGAATYVPRRNRGTEIDPAGLIRPADEALYAAKGSGRNVALHADDLA